MNGKIAICVIFSLIISFGAFLIVENQFPEQRVIKEREFYSKDFSSDNKLIFLLGSSHIGQLNSTLIHENISQKFPNHTTYNLAYNSDTPSERIQYLEKMIELNPELVLYGISYREFQIEPIGEGLFLDPKQFFNDFLINQIGLDGEINPKFITLEIIRKTFLQSGLFSPREIVRMNYTPFFEFYHPQMIIQDEIKLNKQILEGVYQIENSDTIDSIIDYEQITDLRSIIEKFQENKIKIVIIISPLHRHGLEQIPVEAKEHFANMIEELRNTYDVKIYDFSDTYIEQNIWFDVEHVSFNKKSKIYSEDVTDIIKIELKE